MKRFIIFLSTLLVVIALAIIALPFIISADFVSKQVSAAVEEKTGRKLTIKGPLNFSFWPNLAVKAGGVTLSNPPGMYKGQLANIDQMRVSLKVMPLLSRKIEITELTLVKPRLSFVIDAKGKANWDFSDPNAQAKTGSGTSVDPNAQLSNFDSIRLAPFKITGGDVRYLDERSGTVFAATNVDLVLTMPRFPGPVSLKGSLVWNKDKINIDAAVKDPFALTGSGSPTDLSIVASRLKAQFSGRAKLGQGLELAGTIETSTPSIRDLAAWTGNPLAPGKGLGSFAARAALDMTSKSIKLNKARLAIDGMNAQGNVSVNLAGARPKITASIGMDKIDTNNYMAPPAKSAGGGDTGWSAKPIDMSGLKAVDANVSIATSQILYRDVVIGKSRLTATLNNGVLKANLAEMAFYDGAAKGSLVLNGARKKPALQGTLSASGLNAFRLLKDFADFKRLEGTGQIQLSIAATGRSQRELVSTLAGKTVFKFTNGAIRGINIASMVRNVQKSVLGGWDKNDTKNTDFSVLSASFNFKDGIGKNDDLQMLGPLVRLTGKGDVDMLAKRLNYRTEPKLVATLKGQGGKTDLKGIPVPIIVKGPWAKPKIYPDIKGILSNPQAAYNSLSKLIGKGKGKDLDIKEQKKKITKKVTGKVNKIIDKNAGKVVDDETRDKLKKKGKKLLKGLFGKQKDPAPTPAPETQ